MAAAAGKLLMSMFARPAAQAAAKPGQSFASQIGSNFAQGIAKQVGVQAVKDYNDGGLFGGNSVAPDGSSITSGTVTFTPDDANQVLINNMPALAPLRGSGGSISSAHTDWTEVTASTQSNWGPPGPPSYVSTDGSSALFGLEGPPGSTASANSTISNWGPPGPPSYVSTDGSSALFGLEGPPGSVSATYGSSSDGTWLPGSSDSSTISSDWFSGTGTSGSSVNSSLTGNTYPSDGAVVQCRALDCYQACKANDMAKTAACKLLQTQYLTMMKNIGCKGAKCSMPSLGKTCVAKKKTCKPKKKKYSKKCS
jgi:hypothetical protein